jgi:transcriptional regulator with XRE-family HTH domain
MLNEQLISAAMTRLGLNQAALADTCGVSREAVSKWLSGESVPRPAKLRAIAEALQTSVDKLVVRDEQDEPVIAFRTRLKEPLSGKAKARAQEMGRHYRQLLPFVGGARLYSPRLLDEPKVDEAYISEAVADLRASLKLAPTESPSIAQLIDVLHDIGAHIVPVIWGGDKVGHENALTIYLPESKTSWVVLNLSAGQDDFKYWLAHELAHCLTLHKLTDDEGELFAERYAQLLVFPDALAAQALAAMRASTNPREEALYFAGRHGVSVVTVVKSADRIAVACGQDPTGVETEAFYEEWNRNRANRPTVAVDLFGNEPPTADAFVETSSRTFRTNVFDAIARLHKAQGGHSPAFVATLLNVELDQARELSSFLASSYQP